MNRTVIRLVAFMVWGLAIIVVPIRLSLIFFRRLPGPFLPGTAGAVSFGLAAVSLITLAVLSLIGLLIIGVFKVVSSGRKNVSTDTSKTTYARYIDLCQSDRYDAVNFLLDSEIAKHRHKNFNRNPYISTLYGLRIWEYGMQGNITDFRESFEKYSRQLDHRIISHLTGLDLSITLMGGNENIRINSESFVSSSDPYRELFPGDFQAVLGCYLEGNPEQARTAAGRLLESQRAFLQCVALFILSRIAYRQGDFDNRKEYRAKMEALIPSEEMRKLVADGDARRRAYPDFSQAREAPLIINLNNTPQESSRKQAPKMNYQRGFKVALAVVILGFGLPFFANVAVVISALADQEQLKPKYSYLFISNNDGSNIVTDLEDLKLPPMDLTDPDLPLLVEELIDDYRKQNAEIGGKYYASDLTELKLTQMELTDQDLSQISKMQNLMKLDLSGNNITSLDWINGKMQSLEELILSENQITDISGITNLPNLNKLNLSGNQLTDISALSQCTKIGWFYLSDNQITDISALSNKNMVFLMDLSSNPISDLTPLYHSKILILSVRQTNLTDSEIEEYKKVKPDTMIATE